MKARCRQCMAEVDTNVDEHFGIIQYRPDIQKLQTLQQRTETLFCSWACLLRWVAGKLMSLVR